MPFCPQCRYEFVEGVTECPDCEETLVASLPEEEATETVRWAVLHKFAGPVFAEMAKETLEKQSIPCLLKKDFLSSAYSSAGTSVGGLETTVFVPENQLAEAKTIIEQFTDED